MLTAWGEPGFKVRKQTHSAGKKKCSQHQFCNINPMLPVTNMGETGSNGEFNTAPVEVIIV